MSVELIKNIKVLTRIQLRQNKNMIIGSISVLGLFMLISNFGLIFYHNDQTSSFFINTNNQVPAIFIALFATIFIFTTNIITNTRISMYPGTNISRFISRVLSDHIFMVIVFTSSLLMYCIEYPILLLINEGRGDLLITSSFDIKYVLVGIINVLSYILMAYGISILIYSVVTKLGVLKTIILYTAIFIVGVMIIKIRYISPNDLKNYFVAEKSLGIFILKTWSIWFISIILTFLIAKKVKIMKEEVSGIRLFMIPFFFIMIIVFGHSETSSHYSGHYTAQSRFEQLKQTSIYKETLVKYDSLNYKKLFSLNSSFDLFVISETEALKGGIINSDYNLNNQIVVITFFPADKYNNQYIYQYYLDNMNISCEDSFVKFNFPNTKTLHNFWWGDSYKFLKSYDLNDNKILYSSGRYNNLTSYIITPDNIVKN